MPTGCRSVYLIEGQRKLRLKDCNCNVLPAGDLKCRAEDLSSYKFGHLDSRCGGAESSKGVEKAGGR